MFVAECQALGCTGQDGNALQWGRNMFVAECAAAADHRQLLFYPSMGPQHVRCGMCLLAPCDHKGAYPSMGPQHVRCGMRISGLERSKAGKRLQWGRNMFVAECLRRRRRLQGLARPFNGAATCSLRNEHHALRGRGHIWSFNGAATCSLRNAEQTDAEMVNVYFPSMGPQHVRCGMCIRGCGARGR